MVDFPSSPTPGTIFQGGGGAWLWDGSKWVSAVTGAPPGNADYDRLVWLGGEWTVQRSPYLVACYVPGILTSSQNLLYHRFAKSVTFNAHMGNYLLLTSQAACSIAPTAADVTIDIAKAPSASPALFANVASVVFHAGMLIGSFSTVASAPVAFFEGDIMRIRAPTTADATLADVFLTLVGHET